MKWTFSVRKTNNSIAALALLLSELLSGMQSEDPRLDCLFYRVWPKDTPSEKGSLIVIYTVDKDNKINVVFWTWKCFNTWLDSVPEDKSLAFTKSKPFADNKVNVDFPCFI